MTMLWLAAIAFVGTHFILSHPLRAPMVRAMGEGAFTGIYSLVAAVTLGWIIIAYRSAPTDALWWPVGDGLWLLVTALMLIASVLLVGSLVGNPAFPKPGGARVVTERPARESPVGTTARLAGEFPAGTAARLVGESPVGATARLAGESSVGTPREARGVFAVTRHPMMWAFAIWGVAHILVYPITKTFIVTTAMIVLSLVGAALQDRKKARLQPEVWPAWVRQTSYVPFAAILAGRARLGGFGVIATVGGLVVWVVGSWAHIPLGGWHAGIWRWL